MSYVYDKLKDALGGAKFSTSHTSVVRDWSPNSVKAVIVCRNFILVAYHISAAKLINLDSSESVQDAMLNGRSGALHNLLSQRQLSCMEEIYVDAMYMNYPGAMDLDYYINKLKTEHSRLRYYGYISDVSGSELYDCFNKARINGDFMYAYANDRSRTAKLKYEQSGITAWYKNYNLRPQYYAMDADNGALHRWFSKAEEVAFGVEKRRAAELENTGIMQAVGTLVKQDYANIRDIALFMKLYDYIRGIDDSIFNLVVKGIEAAAENGRLGVDGLTPKMLSRALGSVGDWSRELARCYKLFGIFGRDADLGLEEILKYVKRGKGLLCLDDLLDLILHEVFLQFTKHSRDGLIMLKAQASLYEGRIPDRRFRKDIKLKEFGDDWECYLDVLLGVCGWSREVLWKYDLGGK